MWFVLMLVSGLVYVVESALVGVRIEATGDTREVFEVFIRDRA